MPEVDEVSKSILDGLSLAAAWSAFAGIVPPLAAFASLVWTGIRIWEWWKQKKQ